MGGSGFRRCYVGEVTMAKDDKQLTNTIRAEASSEKAISWKEFSTLPFSMGKDEAHQSIVLLTNKQSHSFYAFWKARVYKMELKLDTDDLASCKWEEVSISKGETVDYGKVRCPRLCAFQNLVFISVGNRFDVFDTETNGFVAQFKHAIPLSAMGQHGFVLTSFKKDTQEFHFLIWNSDISLRFTWKEGSQNISMGK